MTETQIPWAPGAQYIHLTCRLGEPRPDSDDPDDLPELMTQGGRVLLTCSAARIRYTDPDGGKRMLTTRTWEFTIRESDGELYNPTTGQVGVKVLSGDSAGCDPSGFTWSAEVVPTRGAGFTSVIPSMPGGSFDLVDGVDAGLMISTGTSTLSGRVTTLESKVTTLETSGGGGNVVSVVSGSEPRPAGDIIFWVGGTTRPTNMTAGDVWFAEGTPVSAGTAPTVTTTSLNTLRVDTVFSQTLAASGSTPISWATTAGTLPAGLSLSTAGVLSGTPTAEGAYTFTVTATNSAGSDTQQYTGTVLAPVSADSVFAASAHDPTVTLYSDGGGSLKMATAFYSTAGQSFQAVGGRVYLPSIPSGSGDLHIWTVVGWRDPNNSNRPGGVDFTQMGAIEAAGQFATVPAASLQAGWNEAMFPTPPTINPIAVPLTADGQFVWVGYHFANGNHYVHAPHVAPAATSANGWLHRAEGGFLDANRSYITGTGFQGAFYGIDILVEAAA